MATDRASTIITASDQTFKSAGKIAFWTKLDSVTRFVALTLETLP
jgi:hypothetical protein